MLMTRNDIIEIKKNSKWSNSEISKKTNYELTELTNDICDKMEKTLQMIAYIKSKQTKEV